MGESRRPDLHQGEIAAAYGLGVGRVSEFINTDRILFETVHGIRINPYLFTGLGLGFDYFYESIDMEDYYGNAIGSYDGAGYQLGKPKRIAPRRFQHPVPAHGNRNECHSVQNRLRVLNKHEKRRRPAGRLLFYIHVTGISVCG